MLKILKNLKQSWISVIVIIILLIIDAVCDLTLPDYTSKIVNVGIQNGGIEDAVPIEISKETMNKILNLTENYENILTSYENNNETFKLKDISKEDREKLSKTLIKPLTIISYLNNQESISQNTQYNIDFSNEENYKMMLEEINKQLDQMPDSILEQTAIQTIKDEYKTIGINTDSIQNKYILIISFCICSRGWILC